MDCKDVFLLLQSSLKNSCNLIIVRIQGNAYSTVQYSSSSSNITNMSTLSVSVGAVMAGLPFSHLANIYDWKGAFLVLEVLSVVMLVLKLATRNVEYKMVSIKKKITMKNLRATFLSTVLHFLINCSSAPTLSKKVHRNGSILLSGTIKYFQMGKCVRSL